MVSIKSRLLSLFAAYLRQNRSVRRDELTAVSDRIVPYGQSEVVELPPPVCTDEYQETVDRLIGSHSLARPFVCELRDATLLGPDAVTRAADGRYVLENSLTSSSALARGLIRSHRSGRIVRRGPPDRHVEHAVSLVGPWVTGYHHWFTDYLPKLWGVREYETQTGTEPTLLVPPDPPTWMRTSLELLGYWDRAVEWSGGSARIDRLVVPTAPHEAWESTPITAVYSPSGLRWVRTQLVDAVSTTDTGNNPPRVYISRNDASKRRVQNETQVLEVLSEYGFQSYLLSELSLEEQIRLFSNADAVVAPHGAGLTNILWGFDIQVLELWGSKDNASYFRIAPILGHTYSSLRCASADDDLIVEVGDLADRLELLYGRNQ